MDAKIAAAEARTDSKFAAVLARLDVINEQLRTSREELRVTRSNVWSAAFAVMGLIVALAALAATVAPASFTAGLSMRELAREEARASLEARLAPAVVQPSPAPKADAHAR